MRLAERRRHHLDELRELWAFAATLDDRALATPSLCEDWTVGDVLGHVAAWERLLGYDRAIEHPARLARLGIAAVRAGGSTDRLNERLGVDGPWPPATTPRRHLFDRLSPGAQLAELVVHHQDIRRPLDAPRTIPQDRLSLALDGVTKLPGVGARARATAIGDGPPTEERLLRLAGRALSRAPHRVAAPPDDTQEALPMGDAKDAKEALERDWEQTKHDLPGMEGKDLDQDAADTVKQALGKDDDED